MLWEFFPTRTGKSWPKAAYDSATGRTVALKKDRRVWAHLMVAMWRKHGEGRLTGPVVFLSDGFISLVWQCCCSACLRLCPVQDNTSLKPCVSIERLFISLEIQSKYFPSCCPQYVFLSPQKEQCKTKVVKCLALVSQSN